MIVIDPNKLTVRISMRLQSELDDIVGKVNAGKGLVIVVVNFCCRPFLNLDHKIQLIR